MISVNFHTMDKKRTFADCFYGSVTMGERGQIVIPVEARQDLGIKPGDKLVIMRDPSHECLMVIPLEELRYFMSTISEVMERSEKQALVEGEQ